MLIVALANSTFADILLQDIGFVVPITGDTYTDPGHLRELGRSDDLRARIVAGDIDMSINAILLTAAEADAILSALFSAGGRDNVPLSRTIASGTTVVPASTTVDLVTATRIQGERLLIHGFVQENAAGLAFGEDLNPPSMDSIGFFFERTANPHEFKARAKNMNVSNSRTLEWVVIGTFI